MSAPYVSTLPAHLISAMTLLQGSTPITVLRGTGAIDFVRWMKAVNLYIPHRYCTGHTSAPRMEILLAELCAHLSGGLEQWHIRSWGLVVELHLNMLADWVT
jgi:hypothetical protein